ncbi:amidohydrolase family protein [Cylindrospermopsis raciborskii Cr2010]|jgi:predicted TIM-barrel fold metal-dependent hydrolase|uniref:amidohydrolase family protein n=1 Tax=Cylindrospermopsis raciborskii TaxID=77022 RepID=UPI000E1E2F5F|nr:amidohydrolase family protein [Cylindrospermopsis raciborskii]UJL34690.1 amidohydrolase family protein [Cylindrospermopsis raciborskii Cr2010]
MAEYSKRKSSRSAAIKSKLNYPVIDTDVHTNDFTPALEDYIANYGGSRLVDSLRKAESSRLNSKAKGKDWYEQTQEERQYYRTIRSPWWARVTRNTLDLATYTLPELFYERQAEQGSDYSVLFPNNVLAPAGASNDTRQALQRAINHYHADLYRKYSDRLTVVAGIPMNTPQEAIEELEFAVKTLGLKVANIPGGVKRPIRAIADKYPAEEYPEIARYASYIDFYGIDSEYDYDPFWAKVVELGVPVTTHYGSQGWTGRSSISNYMNNHIGHFADGSQAFAKALFFGGVTKRFPKLRVGMLEGGADWGAHVYIHLVDRFSKRSLNGLQNYNPDLANSHELYELFLKFGAELLEGYSLSKEELTRSVLGSSFTRFSRSPVGSELEDFAAAGIESIEDIRDRWVNSFFFGSESDDRTIASAFNNRANPLNVKINAIYSSDVGHWDVPDLTDPLAESWDLVQEGVLSEDDFQAYVFGNPYKFYTEANPDFFQGTVIESKVARSLKVESLEQNLVSV